MAKTRGGLNNVARTNTFNKQMLSAAKKIANARKRNRQIKIKLRLRLRFLLPQSQRVQVKRQGHVVWEITVRKHGIYLS